MTDQSPQTCAYCGKEIIGRVDKKFCDDTCRTSYHNLQKKEESAHIRPVNSVLKKNRDILKSLNKTGKTKVHKDVLQKAGFDFNYLTRLYTTQKGSTYYFCYDQGYLPIDNGWYVLVEDSRNN
jgi:hypothetical protein